MPYDTTNGSLNNKIALPNKLYEAMYFQVPIITSKGTYLGELVDEYGIGNIVKCCDKEELLNTMTSMNTNIILKNFYELGDSLYLGDKDYEKLEEYMCKKE
jgi:glycosyltransferase involved in cell wall biosynthesis